MDEVAIERMRSFEAQALAMDPGGYWVADSFGKDSCVITDLFDRAGVAGEKHHSLTTVDPPELIRFGKKHHAETVIDKPPMTMWALIRQQGMPPLRQARYCCQELKERGGAGRLVITGIRAAESPRRSKRSMIEACYRDKTKRYLNPIIDWPTDAVWEYIRGRGLPYCRLYDQGFRRLGCVLCPMVRDTARDIARWPRLAAAWERAIKATFDPAKAERFTFSTGDEYWQWWLDRDARSRKDDQPVLFEDDPSFAPLPSAESILESAERATEQGATA